MRDAIAPLIHSIPQDEREGLGRFRIMLAAVAACLLATGTISCGGGDADPQADDSAVVISDEQLAQMVLSLADFGPEYGAFAPSEENGAQTLEDRVEEDLEPEQEREDLAEFQWASGFDQFFFSSEAVQQPSATFLVGSGLDLFASGDNADAYFEDNQSESEEIVGKGDDDGVVTGVDTFSADVADDSFGIVIAGITDDNQSFWVMLVTVRKGRLMGEVGFGGTGDLPVAEKQRLIENARSLATMLDGKMTSVVSAPAAAGQ